MQQSAGQVLARIIEGIGTPDFAAGLAKAICSFVEFELAAIMLHREAHQAVLLYDNFDAVGGREGIDNYVRHTHAINPILRSTPAGGAFRAREFPIRSGGIPARFAACAVYAPEEELGFRTIGWPERMEEIGLHLDISGGLIEFGLYRERGRMPVAARRIEQLGALRTPIAAAFARHMQLARPEASGPSDPLTAREQEVVRLMLGGYSSEAIASTLGISRHTVKDHRKNIFRKLGIGSLAELFARHKERH